LDQVGRQVAGRVGDDAKFHIAASSFRVHKNITFLSSLLRAVRWKSNSLARRSVSRRRLDFCRSSSIS
jgi:hypothetical protein